MQKIWPIFLNTLPVWIMIALIPLIRNDYTLAVVYAVSILVLLKIHYRKNDLLVLSFGFVIMIVSEYFFITTGVETFNRNTLFGIMPLWLPFLWSYGFVVIKRSAEILNS